MHKTTSDNQQRRSHRGISAFARPDEGASLRKEREKAERAARKAKKRGPMQRLKDEWDQD